MNKGYIDIHSHLLYEIDDGSGNIEESIGMIETLYNAGFSTSYATPHNLPGNNRIELLSKITDRINNILNILEKRHIHYQINTGAENYFDASLNINPEDYFIPLGNTDVFLVEIPFIGESLHHIDALHRTRFHCIIAHVERYLDIIANPEKTHIFKQAGFLLQLNLGSLIGFYGIEVMNTANYLLKKDLIDVIATDIHDIKHTEVTIKKGMKRLGTLVDNENLLNLLKNNSITILNGGYKNHVDESY